MSGRATATPPQTPRSVNAAILSIAASPNEHGRGLSIAKLISVAHSRQFSAPQQLLACDRRRL